MESPREERKKEEIAVLADDRRRTSIATPTPITTQITTPIRTQITTPIFEQEQIYANVIPFVRDHQNLMDAPIGEDLGNPASSSPLIVLDTPKIQNVSNSSTIVPEEEKRSSSSSSSRGNPTTPVSPEGSIGSFHLCPDELANAIEEAQKKIVKVK